MQVGYVQKAYDFLTQIPERTGSADRWMKHCIGSIKFSILVNRETIGFFFSQRGPRQGDPLSPLLFILAKEGMNNLINTARERGWIKGFHKQENYVIWR